MAKMRVGAVPAVQVRGVKAALGFGIAATAVSTVALACAVALPLALHAATRRRLRRVERQVVEIERVRIQ